MISKKKTKILLKLRKIQKRSVRALSQLLEKFMHNLFILVDTVQRVFKNLSSFYMINQQF